MKSNWKQTTLGDVAQFQRGFDLPKSDRTDGQFPLVTSSGQDGTHNQFKVEAPGIVIGRSGTLGQVHFVEKNFWPLNTTLWVKNFYGNDERFVYYLLKTLNLGKFNAGSGVPTLNRNHIHPLPIKIPDLSEQKSIAAVLSSLDDKIELLRAQNKTLEEMAQRLFKEWFVDFNFPNEDGKPYKKSGGRMVESEMGEIPEGWRVSVYSELAHVGTGKNRKKEERFDLGLFPIIGANGELGRTNDYNLEEPAILTGRVGTLGTVYLERRKVWVSDNVLITRAKKKHLLYFLLFVLKSIDLQSLNRGSTQPLITQTDLKNFPIVVPEDGMVQKYTNFAYALFEKVYGNFQQIQTLSNFRDGLLPKLMSGEI